MTAELAIDGARVFRAKAEVNATAPDEDDQHHEPHRSSLS
ncbi:MAG: hypothetical protein JWO36_1690 [Myxococcales bacterium]|nr:hypothetical protein [Myxococcales bacterium]